jgi:ATP-dependent DNA ligase
MLGAIRIKHKKTVVHVGSGFTDSERIRIWGKKGQYRGKTAEIAYQEETNDGSLRFPVFKGVRFDK